MRKGPKERGKGRARKVKVGDGSALKPYRFWEPFNRSLFSIDLTEDHSLTEKHGRVATYQVDIDFFGWDSRAILYRDGRQTAKSAFPARFPVPGGHIEVMTSTFGVRRMHMVYDDGTETRLTPHPRSGEGLRATLDRKYPNVSRTIGVLAVIVLLTSLALGMPQLAQTVSHWDLIADNFGTFTSPFTLPAWLNTALLVASIIAAIERALTLRYHWLIDTDAGLLGS